jgi:hypothetical protein
MCEASMEASAKKKGRRGREDGVKKGRSARG